MTKIPVWENLKHLMIYVILLENYLTISEISIQHLQIEILPILVPAYLIISKSITQQIMLVLAFKFKSLKTISELGEHLGIQGKSRPSAGCVVTFGPYQGC